MTATASDVFDAAVARLKARGEPLDFANSALDCHRGTLLWQRAAVTVVEPQNDTVSAAELSARILLEFDQVDELVELTVSLLRTGADPTVPPHLDLLEFAKAWTTTPESVSRFLRGRYLKRRLERIREIAWRAAAVETSLWSSAAGSAAIMDSVGLSELLVRRVRTVERLDFHVGRSKLVGNPTRFTGGGPRGPWKDGFRLRAFERAKIPGVPSDLVEQVEQFLGGPTHVADEFRPPFNASDPEWRWAHSHKALLYNRRPDHLGPNLTGRWAPDPQEDWFLLFAPSSGTLAAAVDLLFRGQQDWWDRAWLPDSTVLSAVFLEALLFGRRREHPSTGEAQFNALATSAPGFVALGDFFAIGQATHLMGGGPNDPHFAFGRMPEHDLQIGDQVLVWNSKVMRLVGADDEHLTVSALIVGVETDERGNVIRRHIKLQGPSTREYSYQDFLRWEMAERLNEALDQVRNFIAQNPTKTSLAWKGNADILVRWDPYEGFAAPGAWWVRIPVAGSYTGIAQALSMNPGAVASDPNPGHGYTEPPVPADVYFPLFNPYGRWVHDGWERYFDLRRDDPTIRVQLEEYIADARNIDGQGLFNLKGARMDDQLFAIRPKV